MSNLKHSAVSAYGSVGNLNSARLSFDEFVHLSDKVRRAERLFPYEVRALEAHERGLTRRPVQRMIYPRRR